MRVRIVACLSLLACSLCACSTTGDPRQGGLFGWNEGKTRARQAQMQRELEDAQQAVTTERDHAATLETTRETLTERSARARRQLDQLLAENQQLETQLRGLLQQRQLGTRELARLRDLLTDNQQTMQALRSGTAQAPDQSSDVTQQNRRLQREILDLLQR